MTFWLVVSSLCIFVHVRCQTQVALTADASITAAFDLYQAKVVQVTDEINAQVSSVSLLQSGIETLAATFGSEVLYDRFYPATSLLFNAFDRVNFVVNNGAIIANKISVLQMETFGGIYLRQCVTDNLANNLTRVIVSAPMGYFTANQAALTFKSAVNNLCRSAAVAQTGMTNDCLLNGMVHNPPPSVTVDHLSTIRFLSKLYNCLQFASDKVEKTIATSLENMQTLTPSDLKYLLPVKITDSTTPSLVFPEGTKFTVTAEESHKLCAVKELIRKTKDVIAEATALKDLSLLAAISSFQAQVYSLQKYVEDTEPFAEPEERDCYSNTKLFLRFGPRTAAIKLIQCLAVAGIPPTAFAVSTLETSVKERELKENSKFPVVECAVDIHNVFNPAALQKCFERIHASYLTFLKKMHLQVDLLHASATDVLTQARRCVCQVTVELGKAMKDEFYNLGECVTQATKMRFLVPRQPCVQNSCNIM